MTVTETPPPPVARTLAIALVAAATHDPIVTVTGPRQSGKTTLCRTVFSGKPWLTFESPDRYAEAMADPRGLLQRLPDGAILDEIQRVPEMVRYLQEDVDLRPSARGRWILTGSHNLLLSEAVAQSLAGRTAMLQLLPLSLQELQEAETARAGACPRTWEEAAFRGGYPAPLDRQRPVRDWLDAYIANYLERDVRSVTQVGDLAVFGRFVRLCAGRAGHLLNLSALGADAGITHNTAKAWLSVLQATFVCTLLQPWAANLTARETKSPKLYFYDTGLMCRLLGIRHEGDLFDHPLRGAIFENLLVSEAIKAQLHRGQRVSWQFWLDRQRREIDLVLPVGAAVAAAECKSGHTAYPEHAANLRVFQKLLAARGTAVEATVAYGGDGELALGNGVRGLGWLQWAGWAAEFAEKA